MKIQWSFNFNISLIVCDSKEVYVFSVVQVWMSKCLLYIHATPHSDLFYLCLLMILFPSPVMLASNSCRSWSVLIQVSVIMHILMSFSIMWWWKVSSLDSIDCIFISSILMTVWFHFNILHLGSGWSIYWWILLFECHVIALFLPPPWPLNFLFDHNSLIFCRVLSSSLYL